jgi:YihY family inner membrane protein
VSSALLVPGTRHLTGDDAWRTLHHTGVLRLLKDALRRLRVADGFSHARSLAFLTALIAVQSLIGLVGVARLLHKGGVSAVVIATIHKIVPGPAGHILTSAVSQGARASADHQYAPILLGVIGGFVTLTTAMGQLERGLNRIYGIEQDRPTLKKYGLALIFALSAGTFVALAFACLSFSKDIFHGAGVGFLSSAWSIARWPLGLALVAVAMTFLFRWSPRRSQPNMSWLAFGAGVSVLLWVLSTAGLGLFFQKSSSFGATYGPLAGVIALLLWCVLSSVSILYGAAVAAQLEAVRAGTPGPQDMEKVVSSNPDRARESNAVLTP